MRLHGGCVLPLLFGGLSEAFSVAVVWMVASPGAKVDVFLGGHVLARVCHECA